jgi:hypothetical protein
MTKNIIWLSSYPKSGNTWLRVILASLIYSKKSFNFELLKNISEFENPYYFKFLKNVDDFSNLNQLEILSKYWIEAQKKINEGNKIIFFKTHASNISFLKKEYTNKSISKGLIYIIRDPRDVVISYSKHLNKSIDEVLQIMNTINTISYSTNGSYPILLSKWDYHVLSWLKLDVPKIFIKYEHLLLNTENVILQLINFLNKDLKFKLNIDISEIKKIIENTNFIKLQKKELEEGFPEASKHSKFFRSGKIKQWENILTKIQREKIEKNFLLVMKKFNYL